MNKNRFTSYRSFSLLQTTVGWLFVAALFTVMCDHASVVNDGAVNYATPLDNQKILTAKPAKWFDNHASAVSITCDIPVVQAEDVVDEVLKRSLTCGLEMCTSGYVSKNKELLRYVEAFCGQGIHFFGHGHQHWFFDTMSYNVSYAMFDTCYRLMREWNLAAPLAYAYPYGAGNKETTQRAVEKAGFICARGIAFNVDTFVASGKMYDENYFFICSDTQSTPRNWFDLPAVCVGQNVPRWVNYHSDMVKMLDKNQAKKAWMIILYHSIGLINEEAYYQLGEFKKDLNYLAAADIWVVNMDVIARYIRERNSCSIITTATNVTQDTYSFTVNVRDSVDTSYPQVPLTILFDIAGETAFEQCDVVNTGGVHSTIDSIVGNHFSVNILPNDDPVQLKLYRKK